MLFFNLIFYFPIWSTVPAKDRKIQNWVYCGVQRSLTLYCEAEENPPPTYTWTPCDPKQVCNKNTLQISQFFNDTDYTCSGQCVWRCRSKTANVFSHKCIVVMHLTAVSSYMYYHDILIGFSESNQGLACQVIKLKPK